MLSLHSTQSVQMKHHTRQFCTFALWRMVCFSHEAQALMRQPSQVSHGEWCACPHSTHKAQVTLPEGSTCSLCSPCLD